MAAENVDQLLVELERTIMSAILHQGIGPLAKNTAIEVSVAHYDKGKPAGRKTAQMRVNTRFAKTIKPGDLSRPKQVTVKKFTGNECNRCHCTCWDGVK